jgi:hypothetical protein
LDQHRADHRPNKCNKVTVIINVPTAEDYARTGLDLLNLAWRQVDDLNAKLQLFDRDNPRETEEENQERHRQIWDASDRQIANAVVIAQQATEFLLKGRIASVSPYFLISNDLKDWPKPDTSNTIEFSRFKTVDAVQLTKICDAVSPYRLPTEFGSH